MRRLLIGLVAFGSLLCAVAFGGTTAFSDRGPSLIAQSTSENSSPHAQYYGETAAEDFDLWCAGPSRINPIDMIAAFILIIMAGCCLELIAERLAAFTIARSQSLKFQLRIAEALYFNRVEEAAALSAMYPKSPVASVVHASLAASLTTPFTGAKAIKPSMQDRQRAIVIKTVDVKRRLWALAAIGRTAPLVGLLFTSLRIAEEFRGWQSAEGTSFAPLAGGIGDAMWGLSFGLAIAAPAIWMHKYFSSQAETFIFEMDKLSLIIIAQFIDQQEKQISTTPIARYTTQPLARYPTPRTSR